MAIGGYFSLELNNREEYHSYAINLNTGRNALEYILRVRNYSKVYIPYFTCEVLLEPFRKLNIEYEFYNVNKHLEPVFDYDLLAKNEGFLCTNYFGLKDKFILEISGRISNVIVDNAQSFFSNPLENVDTFYSARKFVGTADGAYLYCNKPLTDSLEQDSSHLRMSHLLIRTDRSAEEGYAEFISNDNTLRNQPIKKMSDLTHRLLASVDYEQIKLKRIRNFEFLHEFLKDQNLLKLNRSVNQVPQTYPFWTKKAAIKKRLLDNKIYCATYWPNVLEWCEADSLEYQLATELVHLPIDQRYDIDDMRTIKELVY